MNNPGIHIDYIEDPKVWTGIYKIHTYHLDANLKTSVPQMCSFLFDAAGNHAYELGFAVPELMQTNMTWVLSRFRAIFYYFPKWKESIIIKSWPSGNERLFAYRQFVIYDSKKKLIGRATSAWLLIDLKSRRPLKPEILFSKKNVIYSNNLFNDKPEKIRQINNFSKDVNHGYERDFEVLYSDLDMNNHVTSVSYIKWFLETIPLKDRNSMYLNSLSVNFLAEAHYGDTMHVVTKRRTDKESSKGTYTFEHNISKSDNYNRDKNLDTIHAVTEWSKQTTNLPE